MSVKSTANKIQDTIKGSTLILTAPHIESWPSQINVADLPMVLTRPGPGSWPHECIADVWQRRTYISDIFVKPNSQGSFGEGIDETVAIIQAVGAILSADFELADTVIDSEPRDQGLVILEYGGTLYRGTVFELDVVEDV